MNHKLKSSWIFLLACMAAALAVLNFSEIVKWLKLGWQAVMPLLMGAALAFLINLLMDPIEKFLKSYPVPLFQKAARGIAVLVSILLLLAIFTGLCLLVIPQLVDSIQLLVRTFPQYVQRVQDDLVRLFDDRPEIAHTIESLNIDWDTVFQKATAFLTSGLQGAVDSTFSIISELISGTVNGIVMFIFAIYILFDKERFISLYHRACRLWLGPAKEERLTYVLNTLYSSFRAFVVGQCIEAVILGVTCILGMMILGLPYATMIGTMVGVTNIIPMIGAFIGGAVGVFLVFTVSPVKALIFLVFLCIIQQIESNILYPRIVGNSVGLPGIYVTMVVVVGGSLAGIAGMLVGIPLAAALYKLASQYFYKRELAAGIIEGPQEKPAK